MKLDRLTDSADAPAPVVHPETEPFWAGLAQGELRVQVCSACDTSRYPFAPVCFNCHSLLASWVPIDGNGTVAAAVRVHRATGDRVWAAQVPFLSGIVDLDHGLRLPGRIACGCDEALTRGTPVRAVVMTNAGRGDVLGFAHACVTAT